MKKAVSLILAVLLLFALSTASFATGDYDSIENLGGPIVLSFSTENGVFGKVVVTPYMFKDRLPADKRSLLEAGYNVLMGARSVAQLVGLNEDVTVTEVFDVSFIGDESLNPGRITITLQADLLDRFVALLHFNGASWEVVAGVVVDVAASTLTFTVSDLSPFAIVVRGEDSGSGAGTGKEPISPQTHDSGTFVMVAGLGLLACAGLAVVIFKKKSVVEK